MGKRNFDDLCRIIEKLRSPEGCPWDKEQTHLSLKRHLIEEAYEAAETFDSGSGEKNGGASPPPFIFTENVKLLRYTL